MDSNSVSAARMISLGLVVPNPDTTPAEVVRALSCMQAQALGGALVSIALRIPSRSVAEVRAAFDRGEIVRSWTQRGTIHFAPAEDLGWILGLTRDRIMKLEAPRREYYGVDEAMLDSAQGIAESELRSRGPLTRAEMLEAFEPLTVGGREGEEYGRERYLLTNLSLRGVIAQGPMVDGKDEMRFALLSELVPEPSRLDPEDALREWMRRYVLSHGPVTVDDAARWTGLPKTPIRKALADLVDSGAIVSADIAEREYFHAPDLDDRLAADKRKARKMYLLPGFDELILGYRDRSHTLAAEHEKAVVPGGNGMFKNTVVHGTKVRGTWKRSPRKTGPRVVIEELSGETVNLNLVETAAKKHPAFE